MRNVEDRRTQSETNQSALLLFSIIDANAIYSQVPACHISADETHHLMITKKYVLQNS